MQTLLNKLLASAITAAPVIGYWLLATGHVVRWRTRQL